jgi:hypothetical protein
MARGLCLMFLLFAASPACAQSDGDRYNIMRPEPGTSEPWLAPKYKSPRGTVQHPVTSPPSRARKNRVVTQPPLYVPQTGQTLPNLPTVSPSGARGTETYQDRAVRCAHQAGVYGAQAGDRNAYIGTCINQ